jgi:hypothetical protein
MYLTIVPMQVLLLFEFYEDGMTLIAQGDTKVEFYKETECIKDCIMKRDYYLPRKITSHII